MVHSISLPGWPIRIKYSREQCNHLLIEVESAGGGSDADVSVLNSHNVEIHEVTMHLSVARRWVPATHGQDLQTLHRLQTEAKRNVNKRQKTKARRHEKVKEKSVISCLPVFILWLKGNQRTLFAAWQNVFRRCAINLLKLIALLFAFPSIWEGKNKQVIEYKPSTNLNPLRTSQSSCHWPPRSPSVKTLRNERELQSTPL